MLFNLLSCCPPGRLLILSDNLALVLMLCKGRSTCFYIAFSHASNLCVRFQGRFCLFVQVDTVSESTKSLLHCLAQRSTRSSPTRTNDRDCFSPSLMCTWTLVKFTLHIESMRPQSAQSRAPPNDLSNCTGHAATASSQRTSVIGRNHCTGRFGKQMGHVSLTCCGPLVWLDRNFWMDRR